MKLLLTKTEFYLVPATDEDKDKFNKLSRDETILCTIQRGRNVAHHRKYFALINFIFEHMPEEMHELCPTKTALRKCLQKIAGHTIEYKLPDGTTQVESDTINFSLSQEEFEAVYSSVIDAALEYFITDIETQHELLKRI